MSVAGTKEDVDDELAWLEKSVRRTGRQGEFKSDAYYVVRKLILEPVHVILLTMLQEQ